MIVSETKRLRIRHFREADAEFIVNLLNEPSFIENIADKGVRNLVDAIKYLKDGPIESYRVNGFGLSMVELKESNVPLGMCGLIKREELEDVDIGYALLDIYAGNGYAKEAAEVVLKDGREIHGLKRIIAVTSPDNHRSIQLLARLGFKYEKMAELYGADNKLFAIEF